MSNQILQSEPLLDDRFIARLEQLEIFTRNMNTLFYESGYHGQRRSGEVEFADYKAYTPGDDIRYIDWNVYGRLDSYVTKLFGAEEKKRTNILIDVSGSMNVGTKFLFSLRLGAALAAIGLFSGDIVDIAAFNYTVQKYCGEKTGQESVFQIFDFLKRIECKGKTDYLESFKEFIRVKREPSRIILISDFWSFEQPEKYLNILKSAETDTSCIQVLSDAEISPSAKGAYRFVHIETGLEALLDVGNAEIELYQKKMEKRLENMRLACMRNDMDYIFIPDHTSLEEAVFSTLRDAGIVR